MNNLFPFCLGAGLRLRMCILCSPSDTYEYVQFLNLEPKSDFHFLYLATTGYI